MKRLKRLFVCILAVITAGLCTFGLTGCIEDLRKMELNIKVYNFTDAKYEDHTMDIDLYRHLAPKTVDAIVGYVNGGYYNDTVFYKMSEYSSQIMIGDLKFDEDDGFYKNAEKPTLPGEFKYGGTNGSNLLNKKGSLCLWRTWDAYNNTYKTSVGTDTGSATWFIPTSSISSYNDWFCVFGQYDVNATNNSKAMTALEAAFGKVDETDNYVEYEIYYTGEYGDLEFHMVEKADFDADSIVGLFEADSEKAELVCYNHYAVKVPTYNGQIAAKIVSARIK